MSTVNENNNKATTATITQNDGPSTTKTLMLDAVELLPKTSAICSGSHSQVPTHLQKCMSRCIIFYLNTGSSFF